MQHDPIIRKVRPDSVPYGDSISTTGSWVYAAYDGSTLIVVAATVGEARRKYVKVFDKWAAEQTWHRG